MALASVLGSGNDCVWAVTNDWISSTTASWFTPTNWSLGLPSSSDDVFVSTTNNTTAIIEGSTGATAGNLSIEGGGVTVGNISAGSLTVNDEISVATLGSSSTLTLNIGTLSANTISIGANGSYSDTSAGTILLTGSNPTIQMAGGVTVVVNSQISGTAGLTKAGLGTLTLAGNNTYSGGTTISLGTLQVGNGGTSGTLGSGDVNNNAALVFNRSDSVVVSNVISGVGTLTQAGSGTLTLAGNNTYSGGTTISSGTLQVGNGGTGGSLGSGTVNNNAALVFNRSDSVVASNAISGVGSLTQAGTGTLTLAGNNTYSGPTTISAGTLQVGNGGTSGSLGSGTVNNNAALVFNRSDSVVVSNAISGVGSLTQAGSGTLTVVGNNTYSGSTVISAGTLQVGDGNTSGTLGAGAVSNNSALVFDHSESILVTNQISGSGSLTQAGTGSLILSNANTYSGSTWVNNGGTLSVLNSNALGSGGLNLVNGTLMLGTGIVVNVGGSYTQSVNGTLEVAIGGTNAFGQLNVAGAASLDGTVHVAQANSYVPEHNDTFVLVAASNGVTGTFSTFTNDIAHSSLLNPKLAYDANDVTLEWTQSSFVPYAKTPNQLAVARYLDAVSSSTASSAIKVIDALDYISDTNKLPIAFDQIAPDELSAMYVLSFASVDAQGYQFLNRVSDLRSGTRGLSAKLMNQSLSPSQEATSELGGTAQPASNILSPSPENPWGIYIEGLDVSATVNGDANASGYNLSSDGFTFGVDRRINDQLVLGVGGSYITGSADLTGGGHIDTDGERGQLYAAWFKQGLHLEGMIGGGSSSYDTRRAGPGGFATGSTSGFEGDGLLGGGYDWQNGAWRFGPQLVLQYMSASINGFTETGSLAPLHIESHTEDALHSLLGMHLSYRAYVEGTWTFVTPEMYLAWRHDYLDNSIAVESRLADTTSSDFTVRGPEQGSDSVVLGLGLTVQWKSSISTYLNYTTQQGQTGYTTHEFNGGVRVNF
jgi:outer membrane autotransporter protein